MKKTMLIDGIEVTEDMERVIDWDNSARNIDGTPYVAAKGSLEASMESDPDRRDDGTFKKGHSLREPYAITTDTAKEMQKKSVRSRLANQQRENERQLQAAIQAIATEDIEDAEGAVGYIVAQQAVLAASPDLSPHSSTRAAAFVLKETGRGQEDKRLTVRQGDQSISGGEDTVLGLLQEARRAKQDE